jgi:cysteine desulfurase
LRTGGTGMALEGNGTMRCIYLDYNASTPVDPVVAAAMQPFLEDCFGNPSSGHWAASAAKAALEEARGQIAALLGAEHDEIIFTSGGSEANNLALKGVAWALKAGSWRGRVST